MKNTNVKDQNITILLVDDEEDILEFLSYNLRKEGYDVHVASNGEEALKIAPIIVPDLIVLDIMMPGMDGVMVFLELKKFEALKHTLITFLTARNEDYSQITALDLGGDDYITKPIAPALFISRIRALLRRREHPDSEQDRLIVGSLIIDRQMFNAEVKGEKIALVKKEFELLYLLASKPGKVFNRSEILKKVWGSDVIVGNRTIDVHIRKLREKIGWDYIKTVKGIGYKLDC
jgi:two-component system alkaline phosphatase synthesis response regulator PhoP